MATNTLTPEHSAPVPECAGCSRLRVEVDQLRQTVAALEGSLAGVQFSVRALANRQDAPRADAADLGWDRDSGITASPPPRPGFAPPPVTSLAADVPKDPFEAELARSNALRKQARQAEAASTSQHYRASSPLLRDQQNMVAIKAELRVFEKRMVAAMTKMANRLAAVEADAATLLEASESSQQSTAAAIAELRADKLSRAELKPLVLPIVDTARDITAERVRNLYDLFGLPEPRVQQAVASGDEDRITDTVFSGAPLARLVDALVRTSNDVTNLRDEVRHMHRARLMEGPALAPKQRLLGMAVGDELELRGVRVTQVFAGGPGHMAGFRPGDVITVVNRVHVTSKADFLRVMSDVMPNSVVRVSRLRPGRSVPEEVEVVVGAEPTDAAGAPLY